ncbi:hypothetical protein [Orientia tsutsugamushi]|uniref:Uncharacterized protein n=1 Tax=Orientia tsutsugamushi str. TA716 TaxID=1359175 RepID=A0A0F3PB86_ORITS|nr:hypothetical protein [Orientia tsutsugamushi]KJV77166.1 hypothetical protein OTSTA716_0394 [Orientia tsutsugamushi str. TA716]
MKKKITIVIIVLVALITVNFAADGCGEKSMVLSNFELAASRLGFNGYKTLNLTVSATEHQEALLNVLQIAGYFHSEQLWQAINALKVKDPVATFKQIYSVVKASGANQDDPSKFDAKILRKNFVESTELDVQDIMDLILYLAQYAFNRKFGQERDEVVAQNWMTKYKDEYLKEAEILQLIDREIPKYKNYDIAWIAGASRFNMITRIIDYYYAISKYNIKINSNVAVLTGDRELWANIDGVLPTVLEKLIHAYQTNLNFDLLNIDNSDIKCVDEGKEYIIGLAKKYHIKLNSLSPFIQYTNLNECPAGCFPNRLYPNYIESGGIRLNEALIVRDLTDTIFSSKVITIIDETVGVDSYRPTTESTVRDATVKFLEKVINTNDYVNKKEFIILFQSNNPFILRQTIATQREVNEVVDYYNKLYGKKYSIQVDGIGYKCKADISIIHSEFAALILEKWKDATNKNKGLSSKRSINDLQFQTRSHSEAILPMLVIS